MCKGVVATELLISARRAHSLARYMFDIIYVTWFVHVTTALVSAKFWYAYLVVRRGSRECKPSPHTLTTLPCYTDSPLRRLLCVLETGGSVSSWR